MNIIKGLVILGIAFMAGCNNIKEEQIYDYKVEGAQLSIEEAYMSNKEKIVFGKMADATVVSKQESNNIIPVNASFELTFDKDVTKEYVENVFGIKPKIDFQVEEVTPKFYKLTTVNGLYEDQIYNIEERTTSGVKKWAFQTERIFKVTNTYPSNDSFITETGTIEIGFNGKISDSTKLKDYVEITPKIDGEWKESYGYSYHLESKNHLNPKSLYTVTVKKGLRDTFGNVLKDDYSFKFTISNEEDIYADLSILNNYRPNSEMEFDLNLSMNLNKAITVKDANLKIINLKSKDEFIKAISRTTYLEQLENYYQSSSYKTVFEKNLKSLIEGEYAKAKQEKRYWYYNTIPLDLNLSIAEQGYYLAILDINSNLTSCLFQVNNSTASVSNLANNNFMILYKGKDGHNNSVDVYVNDKKLGSTDQDGFLYIENFKNVINELEKETNYVDFRTGDVDYICDISVQTRSWLDEGNTLTSLSKFNNGYIYIDRNSYKPGETIYYWGYAKNRKIKVENATLKIISNYSDELASIPLKLSEVGTFEGEFTLDNVDKESFIQLKLYIVDSSALYANCISTVNANVRDYELKQYNVTIKPESTEYLDGETAIVNIKAETYDGTPLSKLEFKYALGSNYYYYDKNSQKVDGSVTTNEHGEAVIKVPLKLSKTQTNILSESVGLTILNSYIDGEQQRVYFTVYPYKHYADGTAKYILDENKYHISFNEYLSLDKNVPANDSIKVVAKAFKTVKTKIGQTYNKYLKEMIDEYRYDEVAQNKYDKTFNVEIKDGKGEYVLENYSLDKNCYYRLYAYLITDTGKELALSYDGRIYSYSYRTIFDETEYEEVEYMDPIIAPDLTYTLVNERNDKLRVGDEVYFNLQGEQGKRIKDYSNFEFYTLLVSADGNKIITHKGERPHFTFTKEMGANVTTYTVCYDTLKAYVPTANSSIYYSYASYGRYYGNTIRLCDEELSLDVDVSFDKEVYSPRDEAIIKIKVSKNGKGVKAGVNLSALDTAFIDANGNIRSSILSSLINNYNFSSSSNSISSYSKTASRGIMNDAVAEEAVMSKSSRMGGYDDENENAIPRDDLKITAFFESVVTNENGEAEIKIRLPDNITEWTIRVQAISEDFKAYSDEKKIKVSKDFFVSVNHKNRYLVGEHFAFDIKSFSKLYAGKDVDFEVEVLDSQGNSLEKGNVSAKAQDVISCKIQNPINEKGKYKLKITGTCEGLKDILIDEIEITDSLFDATIREDLILNINDKISIVSNKGYLLIMNKDVAKVLPTLYSLFAFYPERNDTMIINDEASRILRNLFDGNEFAYSRKSYYEGEKFIFKVMKNSSDDARLALRMLSTHAIKVDSQEALEKIEVRLGDFARAWAEVNMGSVSLGKLREYKNDLINNTSSYKVEDALYLALAFADLGSYEDALEIYNMVKDEIYSDNEIEYELKVVLAIKLNLEESEELYNEYIKNQDNMLPENYNFVKLYYVQNMLSKNFQKGEITLNINGVDEVVEVKNVGLTRKLIAGKDDIRLTKMTDNLSFMIEQYKPVDFDTIPDKEYIISKSYSKKSPNLGDLVDVTITVDCKKLYNDGQKYGLIIEDAIPNNMTFVEMIYDNNSRGYLRKQDGQKLTISFWNPYDPKWNPSATKASIKYKVRMTNNGEQFEPGTILVEYNNKIVDGLKK